MILENEGHATTIPPDWWVVKGKSPATRKSPEVSPNPEVHPLDADIDLDDPERYALHQTGSLQLVQYCKPDAFDRTTFVVLQCSLPDDWKNLLKVKQHACMDRKLWKDQADSTDEDWKERQRVFVRRLSNKRNTGPGPNRLEGLNMYEVRALTHVQLLLLSGEQSCSA